MEFVALPVMEGDSFLFKDNEFNLLVDGGKETKNIKIIELLKSEFEGGKVKLDVLICTHYDRDHINGILSLLKSDIEIKEVWMPNLFKPYVKNDVLNDLKSALKSYIDHNKNSDDGKSKNEKMYEINVSDNKICNMKQCLCNFRNYNEYRFGNKFRPCKYLKFFKGDKRSFPYNKFPFEKYNISTIILYSKYFCTLDIISEFYKSEIRLLYNEIINFEEKHKNDMGSLTKKHNIRWFEYLEEPNFTEVFKERYFTGLNCKEIKDDYYLKKIKDVYKLLTPINVESLVFSYKKEGDTSILFTGDSNLECVKDTKLLEIIKESSLITAPHHGSKDNKDVYKLFTKENKVFVRSDSKSKYRPCKEYIDLEKKYCTVCNYPKDDIHKKIKLEFIGGVWSTNDEENLRCKCKII